MLHAEAVEVGWLIGAGSRYYGDWRESGRQHHFI